MFQMYVYTENGGVEALAWGRGSETSGGEGGGNQASFLGGGPAGTPKHRGPKKIGNAVGVDFCLKILLLPLYPLITQQVWILLSTNPPK